MHAQLEQAQLEVVQLKSVQLEDAHAGVVKRTATSSGEIMPTVRWRAAVVFEWIDGYPTWSHSSASGKGCARVK